MAYLSRLIGDFATLLRSSSLNRLHHALDWARICSHLFSNTSLFTFISNLFPEVCINLSLHMPCAVLIQYQILFSLIHRPEVLFSASWGRRSAHSGKIKSGPGWKTLLDSCADLMVSQYVRLFQADDASRQSFTLQVLLEFILGSPW